VAVSVLEVRCLLSVIIDKKSGVVVASGIGSPEREILALKSIKVSDPLVGTRVGDEGVTVGVVVGDTVTRNSTWVVCTSNVSATPTSFRLVSLRAAAYSLERAMKVPEVTLSCKLL